MKSQTKQLSFPNREETIDTKPIKKSSLKNNISTIQSISSNIKYKSDYLISSTMIS